MKIYPVDRRTPRVVTKLLEVWEGSVRATHKFLSSEEVDQIKEYVPRAIDGVEHLVLAEEENRIMAFMGVENRRLEMLFVAADERAKGIGKQLIQYGIRQYGMEEVTVNEQNPQAVGFYEHMGFATYKRTERDEEGNPYLLLYMRL